MFYYLKRIILPNKLPIALHMSKAKIILIYSKITLRGEAYLLGMSNVLFLNLQKIKPTPIPVTVMRLPLHKEPSSTTTGCRCPSYNQDENRGLFHNFFSHNYGNLAVILAFTQFMWQFTVKIWLNYKSVIYRNRPLVQRNTDIFVNAKKR